MMREIWKKIIGKVKKNKIARMPGVSPDAMVSRSARIDKTCCIHKYVNITSGVQISRCTEIHERTSIGRDTKIQNTIIGKYCSVSWNVTIGAPSHPVDHVTMHAFPYQKRFGLCDYDTVIARRNSGVSIGNDVWIGCGSIILSGCSVGDGAIIGAGSVVTRDIPPYTVAAGVPARILRHRFTSDKIDRLMKLKWWDWPEERIKTALKKGLFSVELTNDILLACEDHCRIATSSTDFQSSENQTVSSSGN